MISRAKQRDEARMERHENRVRPYWLEARYSHRFVFVGGYDELHAATEAALYAARNHKHVYRVRQNMGLPFKETVFTAHPDGSWTGKRSHGPDYGDGE